MKQITISENVIKGIRKKGIKKNVLNIIKVLIFYGIGMTILFLTESQNDLFTRYKTPIWFWGIFAIILIFPIWKFQLYKLVNQNYHGKVIEVEHATRLGGKKEDMSGYIDISNIGEMGRIDVCIVTVKSTHGICRKYVFTRDLAQFAREYYQKGDQIFVPLFAEYPFNESRKVETSFCLFCGTQGDDRDNNCPKCGVLFIKKDDQ